eukprot:14795-Heterococcus_DN1.PRE.2
MMDASHAQKSAATDGSSPILDFGVLQNVLSYVGPGHYLFVAAVSKWWKEVCSTSICQQLAVSVEDSYEKTIISCASKKTLYSSAFASPSRVKFAYESGLDWAVLACQRAGGRCSDVATLARAHSLGMQYTSATMSGAAQCNKLAKVQYLHEQGCPWWHWQLDVAARSGFYEVVRWCHEHGCAWPNPGNALHYTAAGGSVELMIWMMQQSGTQLSKYLMSAAAAKGQSAMCQFLHDQQCEWDNYSTNAAASGGHAELLRWLVDNGCPWDAEELCLAAAESGSVDVFVHLQEQGLLSRTATLTDMLDTAGSCNKLAAVKWLRAQGAEWPARFFSWRPWCGDVLAWARAEGCTATIFVW